MDEKRLTRGGRRVPELNWNPDNGRLNANADSPDNANDNLAVRPAAV